MPYHATWIDRKTGKSEVNALYYSGADRMKDVMETLWAYSRPIDGHPLGFRFELRP